MSFVSSNFLLPSFSSSLPSVSTSTTPVPNSSFVHSTQLCRSPSNPHTTFRPTPVSMTASVPPSVHIPTRTNQDPYYGYDLFDPTLPTYSVEVHDYVNGPIDKVFDLARDWSITSPYWNKQFTQFISCSSTSDPDGVGTVRQYITDAHEYSDILLHVDHAESRFVYGVLTAYPPVLRGAVTYADFDPVPGSPNVTKVTWSVVFQPAFPSPYITNVIKNVQKSGFQMHINVLKLFFTPELGYLHLSLTSGSVQRHRPDYLAVRLSDGPITYIETSGNGSPHSHDQIKFPIMSYDDQLRITVYDRKFIKEDPEIGAGYLPVQDLPKKETTVVMPITDTSGAKIGSYSLSTHVQWLREEAPSAAESFGNAAFLIFDDLKQKIIEIAVNMTISPPGKPSVWQYGTYSDVFGPLPKFCKILPGDAALMPKRLGEISQRTTEYVYSQGPLLGMAGTLQLILDHPGMADTPVAQQVKEEFSHLLEDPFMAPFTGLWMPEPKTVIDNLKDANKSDMETAAQLIRGVNPMKITVATKVEDIPTEMQTLTDDRGRSVQQMIADKSLFFCDYWEVAIGDLDDKLGVYKHQASGIGGVGTMGPAKYWYAPHLAVYKRADGKLDILGFTLTRFKNKKNVVYSAKTTPPNQYKLAKFHLACADNQQHQFVSHLGIAHLCMEPFAIANNNAFPPTENRHPIGELLHPHFHDTIGINFLARQTLVSEVAPFTDVTFSPGTKNAMKIFSGAYQKWDFFKSNFVNDLKSRGFDESKSDGLDGFYFREDGFKVWNALKGHYGRIVRNLYKSDADVAVDAALQSWCAEVRDPARGNIQSFPGKLDSIELLVETITTIVFYCSAQHAAVNFSQLRYVSYVPNRPDALRTPMCEPKDGKSDIDADALFAALPTIDKSEFQTMFSYLLTTPPDNSFEVYNTFKDRFPLEVEMFCNELKLVHSAIELRNKRLVEDGDVPYEYLDPMNIPQSINI